MIQSSLNITLNGKPHRLESPLTLAALAASLQLAPTTYAIERNREIVPKAKHAEIAVEEGDAIEIVTFIGGG